eukprot:TRINITY_DN40006_c0_g1_i1.p1 TRINITY_DN40006_c0_g1~~TRINITY_DN40006_c0_g1_i1.p1  ORF type:complete len:464 (+),score=37.49 TRINITY_DN40006_c0_g1_i1:59-1393(+)
MQCGPPSPAGCLLAGMIRRDDAYGGAGNWPCMWGAGGLVSLQGDDGTPLPVLLKQSQRTASGSRPVDGLSRDQSDLASDIHFANTWLTNALNAIFPAAQRTHGSLQSEDGDRASDARKVTQEPTNSYTPSQSSLACGLAVHPCEYKGDRMKNELPEADLGSHKHVGSGVSPPPGPGKETMSADDLASDEAQAVLRTPRASTRPPPTCVADGARLKQAVGKEEPDDSVEMVCLKYAIIMARSVRRTAGSYLMQAIRQSNVKDVRILVDAAIEDVDTSHDGERALHLAVQHCRRQGDAGYVMTELLLEHGATPSASHSDFEAPLFTAARALSPALQLLLKYGADVFQYNASCETPLEALDKRLQEVLPFGDLAGPSSLGFLSSGFTEELASQSAQLRGHLSSAQQSQTQVLRSVASSTCGERLPPGIADVVAAFLHRESALLVGAL